MIFIALMCVAFVAIAFVAFDAWHAEQVIRRVRDEFAREPAPWWVLRD